MFFGDHNSHAVPNFVSSNFLPSYLLYFNAILHAVHDISNSLTPTYISHLFTAQSSISSHSTQSSTRDDYYVKHSIKIKQTKYHVSLFQDMVSKSGKVYLVKCVTYPKINFKINVHDALLRILTKENNCIALPALITKIS